MGINVIYSMMKTLEYIYEDNHEYFIDNKGVVLFKNKKTINAQKIKLMRMKSLCYWTMEM